eukprot:6214435-Pleurochrysis_carterae.AAC.5
MRACCQAQLKTRLCAELAAKPCGAAPAEGPTTAESVVGSCLSNETQTLLLKYSRRACACKRGRTQTLLLSGLRLARQRDRQHLFLSPKRRTCDPHMQSRHLHAKGAAARVAVAVGEVVGDDGCARRVGRDGAGEDVRQVNPRGAAAVKRQIGEKNREARACTPAKVSGSQHAIACA